MLAKHVSQLNDEINKKVLQYRRLIKRSIITLSKIVLKIDINDEAIKGKICESIEFKQNSIQGLLMVS